MMKFFKKNNYILTRLCKYNFADIDLFAPWILFPAIYILYFCFGSLKLTILPSPSLISTALIFIALIFYLLGSYVFLKSRHNIKLSELSNFGFCHNYLGTIIHKGNLILLMVIFVAILFQSFKYGIPILSPEIRGGVSIELLPSAKLYALFGLMPLSLSLYIISKMNSDINKSYLAGLFIFGLVATLFTSYRTTTVLYLLTFILLVNYIYKKLSWRTLLPFAAIVGTIIVGIQQYRLYSIYSINKTNEYFKYINPNGYPDALIAAHLPCHEGAIVFSDIIKFTSSAGLLYGELSRSIFEAMLPGIQMAPRTFFSLMRETSLASSTTPSILGGPYIDFGVFGIVLFMFAVGFILTFLYISLMNTSQTSPNSFCNKINAVSYSYILSISLISIHSGLLDPIIIISMLFIIFLQSFVNGWLSNEYIQIVWLLTLIIFIFVGFSLLIHPTISSETTKTIEFCNTNIKSNIIYLDQYLSMSAIMFQNHRFQTLYSVYTKSLKDSRRRINSNYIGICVSPNIFYNYSLNHQFETSGGINAIYANDKVKMYKNIYTLL
jgi:oligosaccharide repeat unit polymerase